MDGYGGAMSLTPQQELFAQKCVELCNQSAAYRAAYKVSADTKWTTVATDSSRLAAMPEVAARIRELQDQAAAVSALPSLAARIQELRELETANPDELVGIRWVNCRHCRGLDHHYQWADDMEYAKACDDAALVKEPLPDMSGGFGYNPTLESVADCPRCWGVGQRTCHVADTSKLTGGARRLYKGVKIKGNGDIEILMHDQQKATDMLNRIQGAYKDGAAMPVNPAASAATAAIESAKTPDERQRNYLRMVRG